jgi:hypothetical protein
MKWMKTEIAEKAYALLVKYANADPSYYQKEGFIFHFGVIKGTRPFFKLKCLDNEPRKFIIKEDKYIVHGKGTSKLNAILNEVSST